MAALHSLHAGDRFLFTEECCSEFLQPFSRESRTPTVAKEFQIGLYDPADPAEADLELFCNCWSAGFLGERLYDAFVFYMTLPVCSISLCRSAHRRLAMTQCL